MATTELVKPQDMAGLVEQVVVGGDLSKLSPKDRLNYYNAVCKSVGLNPLTRPFDYLNLSGRLVLYAKRDATDQLRKLNNVSIEKLERETVEGVYVVTAYAKDAQGRVDSSIGAVPIENLRGEAKANALMKCETKAKRRVTLSICGLGMLDETETASIPDARPSRVDYETGEVLDDKAAQIAAASRGPLLTEPDRGPGIDSALSDDEADEPLDETLERSILLGKAKGAADKGKLSAKQRADLLVQVGITDPRAASLEQLHDLYAATVKAAGQ